MSTSHSSITRRDTARTLLQTIAGAFGAVFLLVGILGFVPGITTSYGDLSFAGHTSDAKLVGVFEVSVLHNLVHLAYGVAGLAAMRRADASAAYLVVGGLVYAVVWIYGVAVGDESSANFVPLNTADNWLHLVLAVAMVALGLDGRRRLRGNTGLE